MHIGFTFEDSEVGDVRDMPIGPEFMRSVPANGVYWCAIIYMDRSVKGIFPESQRQTSSMNESMGLI